MVKARPKRKPVEQPRHRAAFDFFMTLEKRSDLAVAKKFAVTRTAVRAWHRKFDWTKRAAELDAKVAKKADVAIVDELTRRKKNQLAGIRLFYAKWVEKMNTAPGIKTNPLSGPPSIADFIAAGKHELFVMGEATDRTSVEVTVEDWIRGKKGA